MHNSFVVQKTLSVCIIGKPNAGKSSLLNRMIGHKISIVTPKVQTTRSVITGIVTIDDTQLILLDTPGIFEPSKQLEKAMVRCAWSSLYGADVILLIIDNSQQLNQAMFKILDQLKSMKIKPILILNKMDISKKCDKDNESILKQYFDTPVFFRISAINGTGVNKLLQYLCNIAHEMPWLYDEDDITTAPMKFLASEITREQLFLKLHEELPYNLTVETERWREQNHSIHIHQAIIVSRESYKTIILGAKGLKIKEIGSCARLEMEKSFETKVHLFLFVKVRKSWENMPEFYQSMGLKFEKTERR